MRCQKHGNAAALPPWAWTPKKVGGCFVCERDIFMEVPVLQQARNLVVKNRVSENTTVRLHQNLQKTFDSHQNINTLAQAYIARTI